MTQIWIPFKIRFKEPLLNDTKTWTSRTKRYGKVGDTFSIFGATFEILEIVKMTLEEVANNWKKEGCESKKDFIEIWEEIHPIKGFIPTQRVFVHIFKKV